MGPCFPDDVRLTEFHARSGPDVRAGYTAYCCSSTCTARPLQYAQASKVCRVLKEDSEGLTLLIRTTAKGTFKWALPPTAYLGYGHLYNADDISVQVTAWRIRENKSQVRELFVVVRVMVTYIDTTRFGQTSLQRSAPLLARQL